jgi:hypothetical protein
MLSHPFIIKQLCQTVSANPSSPLLLLLITAASRRQSKSIQHTIRNTLKLVPVEILSTTFAKLSTLSVKSPLFDLLNTPQKKSCTQICLSYLSTQFLIDKSDLPFYAWFSDVLDTNLYKQHIHSTVQKLINRSSSNITILYNLLKTLSLDLSPFAKDYFDLLKNLLIDDRYCEKAIFSLTQVFALSKSLPQDTIMALKALI